MSNFEEKIDEYLVMLREEVLRDRHMVDCHRRGGYMRFSYSDEKILVVKNFRGANTYAQMEPSEKKKKPPKYSLTIGGVEIEHMSQEDMKDLYVVFEAAKNRRNAVESENEDAIKKEMLMKAIW